MKYSILALNFLVSQLGNFKVTLEDFYNVDICTSHHADLTEGRILTFKLQGHYNSDLVRKINRMNDLEKLVLNNDSGYLEGDFRFWLADEDYKFVCKIVLT